MKRVSFRVSRGARGLSWLFAGLVALRLLVALAPGRPLVVGLPLGLALELLLVASSTAALWCAVRRLLPTSDADDGTRAAERLLAVVTREGRSR